MAIPYQPQNLTAEQSDGNILLTWSGSLGATGYKVQRSTDGVNFTDLATTTLAVQYVDSLPGIGIMYYYQVAATNSSGTSTYSSPAQMVAAPPSEMSLFELRLRSQQTADRVNSKFVVVSEWNAFLRLAMYELYDLLITSYEDLFASKSVIITTNGATQNYPLPDGVTNYLGGTYPDTPPVITLIPNPGLTFVPTISAASFDPLYAEFASGVLREKDQRPASATFYAAWTSQLNANWSGVGNGSLVVTPFNGAAISGGKLDLTGYSSKYVTFSPINNADTLQTGTIEFQVTPNYSGTPAATQVFVNLSTGGTDQNRIVVFHYTTGDLYVRVYDSASVLKVAISNAWVPVSGTTYTIRVTYDGTGSSKIFIDGVQQGTTSAVAFTRAGPIDYGAIGDYPGATPNANFSILNFSVYSIVTTPSSAVLSPTIYVGSTASLPLFTYAGLGSVLAYTAYVATDSGTPHYTLNGKYWDGSAWVTSNGTYAQSNDISAVSANISSFPTANTLQINVIFQSGSTQENIGALTVTYSGQQNLSTPFAPSQALYKLAGVDLGVNTSNNAWVTLERFNFIDRNDYVYPNSTSTIYGVYNMRYRLMGDKINIIPTPAGNQQVRLWYSPKLLSLLRDTDLTTLGYSGWIRYAIVRAAKYALDKEESDTSKLDAEIGYLKTRIEQASQNRDAGAPDTISNTRQDPVYGGSGFGGGNHGGW